jgi:hypothetical protein
MRKSCSFLVLAFCVLGWSLAVHEYRKAHPDAPKFNPVSETAWLGWYNSRPMPTDAIRVLFIGEPNVTRRVSRPLGPLLRDGRFRAGYGFLAPCVIAHPGVNETTG